MTKARAPGGEITADEVSGWFPGGRHPRPTPEHCRVLADTLELYRVGCTVDPRRQETVEIRGFTFKVETIQQVSPATAKQVVEVARSAVGLQGQLELARCKLLAEPDGARINGLPPGTMLPEIDELLMAIKNFLFFNTPTGRGHPAAQWVRYAAEWAVFITDVQWLSSPRKISLNTYDGPVVKVLVKAILRVFGKEIDAQTISNALSNRQGRQNTVGIVQGRERGSG